MNVLLCRSSLVIFDKLLNRLETWGFNPIVRDNESEFVEELQNENSIRIVLLSNDRNNLQLTSRISTLKPEIYIISHDLIDTESNNLDSLLAGANVRLRCSTSYEEIKELFLNIQRLYDLSEKYGCASFSRDIKEKFHILNIKTYKKNQEKIKIPITEWWSNFVKTLEKIGNDEYWHESSVISSLLEQAVTYGLEDLANTLKFMRFFQDLEGSILRNQLFDRFCISVMNLKNAFNVFSKFDLLSELEGKEKLNPLVGAKILLVEDLEYNRKLVKKILEKSECEVTEAIHGLDAIQKWKLEGEFDVIVMDMNMPVMDGFEATKQIRKIEKKEGKVRTPILALSALAMRGDRESCLQAGCDGYIPKPVEAVPFLKTCAQYIDQTSELESDHNRHRLVSNIKWILLKTSNQIYQNILDKVCSDLHLNFNLCVTNEELLEKIDDIKAGFVILEFDKDLEMAYLLKEANSNLQIALIAHPFHKNYGVNKDSNNIIEYPFEFDQVFSIFKTADENLLTNRIQAEELADIKGLSEIKSQLGIDECVRKSNGQLAVWQRSMRKVGGDLVLSQEFNYHGKFGFILGDVSGHDVKAGYAASLFAGLVKGIWRKYSDPLEMLINLNNLFLQEAKSENPHFVCSLILLWDPIRKKLQYANAGIPEGMIVKKTTGESKLINWKGIPVGMFPNMDLFDYGTIEFNPGDRLYMATDGVLEAIPNEVIIEVNKGQTKQGIQEALNAIVDFVCRSIEIKDDLTIVLFEAKELSLSQDGARYSFQSTFQDVDKFVLLAKEYLDQYMPDKFEWAMISIALRESCCNAVEHGNKNRTELPIDVDFEILNGDFVVSISDAGSGFDLSNIKKRLKEEGQLRFHGRGVDLMENIAQSVSYNGSGVRLTFLSNDAKSK